MNGARRKTSETTPVAVADDILSNCNGFNPSHVSDETRKTTGTRLSVEVCS